MRLIASSALGAGFGVLLLLAACAQSAEGLAAPDLAAAPAPQACAAGEYQTLVGQLAREVDTASLPQPSRILMASDTVTGAEEPARMTLVANGQGRVAEVVCG